MAIGPHPAGVRATLICLSALLGLAPLMGQDGGRRTCEVAALRPDGSVWRGAEIQLSGELEVGVTGDHGLDRISATTGAAGSCRVRVLPGRTYFVWARGAPAAADGMRLYAGPVRLRAGAGSLKLPLARRVRAERRPFRVELGPGLAPELPLRVELRHPASNALLAGFACRKSGPLPSPLPPREISMQVWTRTGLPLDLPRLPLYQLARRWVIRLEMPKRFWRFRVTGAGGAEAGRKGLAGVRALPHLGDPRAWMRGRSLNELLRLPSGRAALLGPRSDGQGSLDCLRCNRLMLLRPGFEPQAFDLGAAWDAAVERGEESPEAALEGVQEVQLQRSSGAHWTVEAKAGGLLFEHVLPLARRGEAPERVHAQEFVSLDGPVRIPAVPFVPGRGRGLWLILDPDLRSQFPLPWRHRLPSKQALPLPAPAAGEVRRLDLTDLVPVEFQLEDAQGKPAPAGRLRILPLPGMSVRHYHGQSLRANPAGQVLQLLPRGLPMLLIVGSGAASQGYVVRIDAQGGGRVPAGLSLRAAPVLAVPYRVTHKGAAFRGPFGFELRWEERQQSAELPRLADLRALAAKPRTAAAGILRWRRLSVGENWSVCLEAGAPVHRQAVHVDAQGSGRLLVPAVPQRARLELRPVLPSKNFLPARAELEVGPGQQRVGQLSFKLVWPGK